MTRAAENVGGFNKLDLLRQIIQADVERDGPMASVMVRGGLLLELLDSHAEMTKLLRQAHGKQTCSEPLDLDWYSSVAALLAARGDGQ